MKYGEKIRELRIQHGLSQSRLASLIGVSRFTIINYEKDRRTPNMKQFEQLSKVLNMSFQDFL